MTKEDCAEADGAPYHVLISDRASEALSSIRSKADARAVARVIDLLDTVPYLGRVYDPLYDAAHPDFETRVAYAGHCGVYYEVIEGEQREVHVLYIEDQRRDPLMRFS